MRNQMRCRLPLCLALWLCLWLPRALALPGPIDNRTVVGVPSGVTPVLAGDNATQQVSCVLQRGDPLLRIKLSVSAATDDPSGVIHTGDNESIPLVTPAILEFAFDPREGAVLQTHNFTIAGREPGRFYLSFAITQGSEAFRLSASSSVVVVETSSSELGWDGIWYELAFNAALLAIALAFFAWRRVHQVKLPIWHRGSRPRGLFERANFEDVPQASFERRYGWLGGSTVATRSKTFWETDCSDPRVAATCGVPATLSMQFHADAARLMVVLSILSLGVMLPVNYMSGNHQPIQDSFQQTTLSNVPLHSAWYWVHVAYCYVVAVSVVAMLIKQEALASRLRRLGRDQLVGARSVLIQRGLPPSTTSRRLKSLLHELMPDAPTDVALVFDLRRVHWLLARRQTLGEELARTGDLETAFEAGTLSWNLVCCPGSIMAPDVGDMLSWYCRCRPCRYLMRQCQPSPECRCYCCKCCCPRHHPVSGEQDDADSTCCSCLGVGTGDREGSDKLQQLRDELAFFPDEALEVYESRQCVGAAFVTFQSAKHRSSFERTARSFSCRGRITNSAENFAWRLRGSDPPQLSTIAPHTAMSRELVTLLPRLTIKSAPEPADVIWENVAVPPTSFTRWVGGIARHIVTIALLLLFSTPSAVLVYIKLDSASAVFSGMTHKHGALMTLAATYLPSLLLIIVNWLLLTFLYYLSRSEPAISETRRTKSFLVKGFSYLVVSSVLLPSIGVTVAYLAVSRLEHDEGRDYIESFLYKVSGTFFISYVCQRAFLGAIFDITRASERLVLQPWMLARSVTEEEKQRATRPDAFYYGHDYALVLSVLLVVLLGTVITPLLTPFGALYFSLKFVTTKYNFLYVVPFTAGRGHVAQTAHALTLVCLLLFELAMAFVLLQVAGRAQFIALATLFAITAAFYGLQLSHAGRVLKQSLALSMASAARLKTRRDDIEKPGDGDSQEVKPKQDIEGAHWPVRTYADPYKATLSIFKLLGVNQVHRMDDSRTQLRYAFLRLRQHAEHRRVGCRCCRGVSRPRRQERSLAEQPSETTHLV